MIVGPMIFGVAVGTCAALWAWLGLGLSLWWALAVYAAAGAGACIASAGVAVITAMICSRRRERAAGRHAATRVGYRETASEPQA